MKQNKFDISFQIGPWNLESLICNTHMRTRVRACTYTRAHAQISTNKGNGYGSRLWFLIDTIFDYTSILLFWSENDIMENACKEVRSRQTFPWQAVAFYGGIRKNVYIKRLLFFHLFKEKLAGLQWKGEGRKQQYSKCFTEKNILILIYLFTSIG